MFVIEPALCPNTLYEVFRVSHSHLYGRATNCRHGDVSVPGTVLACYQYGRLIEGYARIDIHLQTEMTFSSQETASHIVVAYQFIKAEY